jgi:hypothetical protein
VRRRGLGLLLWTGAAIVVTAGCGKRGDPLPPLRPVPAAIEDLTAQRLDNRVELQWTVPSANMDGTTPPAVDRVDVFAVTMAADAAAPAAGAIVDPRNLIVRSIVRRQAGTESAAAATPDARPGPGERATHADRGPVDSTAGPQTRHYVAVAATGTSGTGRPGPPSPVVSVPMGPLPQPPAGVSLTHDETSIRLSWQPSEEGARSYRVYQTAAVPGEPPSLLMAEPLTAMEFAVPVIFGRESCFSVQPLQVAERVTIVGSASPPQCITPTDTYAPPVPTGLQAVQEGPAITLIWTPVAAADLAGYIVLRGEPGTPTLQPLMTTPLVETTYRDMSVQPGASYVYAIYAVDKSPAANASAASEPRTIAVR